MKRRRIVIAFAAIALIVTAVTLARRTLDGRAGPLVASGTIEATEVDLGFQLAGRVATVAAREGDVLQRGDELATLDRRQLMARRRASEASLGQARAALRELETGFRPEEIEQGRAALRAAAQRLSDARRDVDRTRRLVEAGALSRQQLEADETRLELAVADEQRAREALTILETGPRAERLEAQRAAVVAAQASLAELDARLQDAVIVAPLDGVVTIRHREPGEAVTVGAPVLTLVDLDDRWVRIYVREDAVGRVSLGQPAEITADTFRDRTYEGEVIFISSEAEFTPRNVQTREERVKLVYEVKVRITGDDAIDLKPGLAADVRLDGNAS